jgi:hypothetical protein
MTNHEHLSEPDPSQPNPADRPYSELGPAAQTYLEYIATGRFDPLLSTEDLRMFDSIYMKMAADLKFLIDHGELPPDAGLTPEMLQYLEAEDDNGTLPQPPDTPPSPETPQ